MKRLAVSMYSSMWIIGLLGFAVAFPVTAQNTTVFSAPMQYCFRQLEWSGDLSKVTLKYNLIVEPQHHFKEGDVFIGFRHLTRSGVGWDAIWLLGRRVSDIEPLTGWYNYVPNQEPPVFFRGPLQPVIPATILSQPLDLTAWNNEGDLLVGYGLRTTSGATAADSFQEMLDNKRYHTAWLVQNGPTGYNFVCLKATEMSVYVETFPF